MEGCGYSPLPDTAIPGSVLGTASTPPLKGDVDTLKRIQQKPLVSVSRSTCGRRRCQGIRFSWPGQEKAGGGSHCRPMLLKRGLRIKMHPSFSWKCTVTGQEELVSCCKPGKFFLVKRNSFFTTRVLQPWDRLPGEVVESPSSGISTIPADKALRAPLGFEVSPALSRRLV